MKKLLTAIAIATALSLASTARADTHEAAAPAPAAPATEQCYGVAKEGPAIAIELPAGVCEKLANGSLTAPPAPEPAPAPAEEKK